MKIRDVAGQRSVLFNGCVSLEKLKREAAALDAPSRKELMAFLISMREEEWATQLREASKRLDDPDQNRWLSLEE